MNKELYEAPVVQVLEMEVQASVMEVSRGDTYGDPIDLNNNG